MLVHTEITVLQPSDLQVIRQLPCTGIWMPMLLTMRLFTPTCRHPAHTVDMVLHREFMQWNPLSMSWLIR